MRSKTTRRFDGVVRPSSDACAADIACAAGTARRADVACVAPPAERFAGKNAWWAYAFAVAGIAVPLALTAVGLPGVAALAVAALLSLRTVPPLARNWVDLYADRFTVVFGMRTVTVRIAQVGEVGEVRRTLGASTANAFECVRVALRGCRPGGGEGGAEDMGPSPSGELFVALHDNARFAAELAERRRDLRHRGPQGAGGANG